MLELKKNNEEPSIDDIAKIAEAKGKMFVTIKEFSEITGIKEHSLRILTKINGFPALKIGVKYMVLMDEAMAWLRINAKVSSNGQRPLAL
ncbi:MAG: helix-turn-helix domain-containing protein [Anaerovibrio sp.]|uniref:helix-turn-helix domain-containing protein n=1 Tax=Anaerovibrio sp. TaxID=1872532 RepID=UPI0025E957D2|nr:helix-turn-helix domain-containing protein [Anaerovibrio sp.]MCR5175703.1 helix-turn-helix domain-containing protein [Anaerovibrio sp.]